MLSKTPGRISKEYKNSEQACLVTWKAAEGQDAFHSIQMKLESKLSGSG